MADEDKLVKAGVEAALKPFADMLEKIAGPAAEEFGLALRDHVRVFRLKRQVRLFKRVEEMLRDADVSAHRVPLKILSPIIDAGTLEEDDYLQDRWAALLANSASGAISPAFAEILNQISHDEVRLLHSAVLHIVNGDVILYHDDSWKTMHDVANKWATELKAKGLIRNRVKMLIQNLTRLGLVKNVESSNQPGKDVEPNFGFWLEELGLYFAAACEPPELRKALMRRIDRN